VLQGNDHVANVSVLAACDARLKIEFDVVLTQGSVSGEGHFVGQCTGQKIAYPVTVPAQGPIPFTPGPAQADSLATIKDGGTVVGYREWTPTIQLVEP